MAVREDEPSTSRNGTDPGVLPVPGPEPAQDPLAAAEAVLATDPSRALALARQGHREAETPGGSARALFLIGSAEYRRGRLKEAVDPLERAEACFRTLDDPPNALRALLALARVERDLGRFEGAARRCDAALELARSLRSPEAEADALNLQAGVCNAVGEYTRALECLEGALAIAREHDLTERQGNILSNIGSLHTALGNNSQALESLTTAYELVQVVAPGTRTEATNLVSLGHLYREMGETEEARRFLLLARDVSRQAGDPALEAAVLNNLANICSATGDWESARELFQEALGLARELGMRQYELDNMDGLGQVHAALGAYEPALRVHLEVRDVAREIGDREGETDALLNLGRDYLALGEPGAALEPLGEGLALAELLERKHSIYQAHELLAEAYERTGDPARALHHHRSFHRVEKTVFNEESEQRTRRLAVQFELERARHDAEQYRLRNEITQQARDDAEAKVRQRTRELQEAQQEVVTRLAVAAEYRDDDTGDHIWRVGRNAAAIARAMGWPEDDVELVFSAARLHDIGKIGIPDAVLLKPGKLTDDEFELIRTHTTIGARILAGGKSRLLRMAEEIALSHHERWDGRGYPLGLAGDAIPLSARIVAVADVLDALTHVRPYKRAWPVAEALAEIRRQSGSQFDPRVVEASLQVFALDGGLSPLDTSDRFDQDHARGALGERPRPTPRLSPDEDVPGVKARLEKILMERTREFEASRRRDQAALRRLQEVAFSDVLTGLGNRRAFEEDLEGELARARRTGDTIGLLTLDLDAMKALNDSEGHDRGDAMLKVLADAIRDHLRDLGRVYRVGGDEFTAILPGIRTDAGPEVLARVERAVATVRASGFGSVGVSWGLAVHPDEAGTLPELVRLSDQRMYRSKVTPGAPER